MPLVVMHCKQDRLLPDMIQKLAQELPVIVSRALHVEENPAGHLGPRHIEVRVTESSSYDVNISDVAITVWANLYPERLANLDERREKILAGMRDVLRDYDRDIEGDAWVLLQAGSFGKL